MSETGMPLRPVEPFLILKCCVNSLIYPAEGTACSRPENLEMFPAFHGVAIRHIENLTGGSEPVRVCTFDTLRKAMV